MPYDARQPDAPITARDVSPRLAGLVPTRLPPALLAKVGESFAGALSALRRSLAGLGPVGPGQQSVLDAGLAEIARLEHLGIQIQKVARVLIGDSPAAPERVDLARAAREALAAWTQMARPDDIGPGEPTKPFDLEVNAAVLEQLLDLGIDYALNVGAQVDIGAAMQGLRPHPVLSIRAARRAPAQVPARGNADVNELHWLLFAHLARAVGLAPHRLASAEAMTLTLTFPGSDVPGASPATTSPAEVSQTAAVTGRRVLLVEQRDIARVQAERLLLDAGMRVDSAASVDRARAGRNGTSADVLVTGVPVDDERCAALIDELRAAQPRLRVVELVDDDNAFAFSVPGSDRPARVGRNDMARTLVRAISEELDSA